MRDTQTKETKNGAGYLSYEEYYATWEDEMPMHDFERLNRMASSMVDCLASRFVDGNDHHVKDAVSWQIWFMRQKGSLSACFEKRPLRESFADYAIERSGEGGIVRLLGVELCPMTLQLLRAGGVVTTWI